MKPKYRFCGRASACLTLASSIVLGSLAHAADVYWDTNSTTAGTGTSGGTWNTSTASWSTDSTGVSATANWTNGDNAIFSAGTNATGQFTVTMGNVTVGNITVEEGRVQLNSSGTLTLNSGTNTYTVARTSGDYDLRIDSVVAGTGSIIKEGAGMMMLTGSNTFSGGITLNAGTLNFESSNTAFGTGTLTLNGGNLAKTWGNAVTFSNAVNVTGTTNVGIVQGSANDMTFTGAFTGSGTFSVGNASINGFAIQAASIRVTGDLSGFTGTFQQNTLASGNGNRLRFGPTSAGSTTVNLSNGKINTTGATSTSSGSVIDLGDNVFGTFKIGELAGTGGVIRGGWGQNAGSGDTTFEVGALNTSSTFAGSLQDNLGAVAGKSLLNKVGTGTLTLSGANAYTGGTTLTGGKLSLGSSGAIGSSGNIVFNGGTLQYSASNTTDYSARIASGTSAGAVSIDTNGQDVTFGTALTASQSGGLSKLGNGKLTLNANNAYTGQTTVSAGTLALGAAERISNSSSLVVNGGTFDLNGFDETVAAVTISSGSLNGTSNTLTGSSYALQGGTVNAKLGAGAVSVSTGTTTLGSAGRLNSSSSLSVSSGQLTLGGNESVASYVQTGGTLGGSGKTLTSAATYDLQAGTVNANLGGSGIALTKSTVGNATLAGANTYTGATSVTGGTLTLTGSVSSTAINVSSGATYDVSGVSGGYQIGNGVTVTNNGTVAGAVKVGSGGMLAGSGEMTSLTTVQSGGTLAIGNSPGTMTFDQNLVLENGSISNFQIDSAGYGAGTFDLAVAAAAGTQNVAFDGTLNLFFNSGESYANNSSVQIFKFDGYSGDFAVVNYSGLAVGQSAVFDAASGTVTVVPEPGAALLGGLGMLALLRRRRVA